MKPLEIPIRFPCRGAELFGIIRQPEGAYHRGVLSLYRTGFSRLMVFLTRQLAENSIPSMRIDLRGDGYSEGATEERHLYLDDIMHALNVFTAKLRNVKEVYIVGHCVGTLPALRYAISDSRVTGLVLIDPIARTSRADEVNYRIEGGLNRFDSRILVITSENSSPIASIEPGGETNSSEDDGALDIVNMKHKIIDAEPVTIGTMSIKPADHFFSSRQSRLKLSRTISAWIKSLP